MKSVTKSIAGEHRQRSSAGRRILSTYRTEIAIAIAINARLAPVMTAAALCAVFAGAAVFPGRGGNPTGPGRATTCRGAACGSCGKR